MKRIIFFILTLLSLNCGAQTFDNAIARYITDSTFNVHVDSEGHEYVNIRPYRLSMKTTYTQIYFEQFNDFSSQPYQILPRRDSIIGGDTMKLPALIGTTKSANCHFILKGDGVQESVSIPVTNVNSNAYNGSHLFLSTKFLYWYLADRYGMTIQ